MNHSLKQPPRVKAGSTIKGCNFTQKTPGTKLINFPRNLTFIDCNLRNVDIDSQWTLIRCNAHQAPLPAKPTKKQVLRQEKQRMVADRVELTQKIADITAEIGD